MTPNIGIIIGSGTSLKEGISLGLWERIKGSFTIGINHCYSGDTEVFTDEGWKYFKDLNKTESILTRTYKGDTKWSSILNYIEQDYNGEMINLKNKQINLLVTPEHNFYLLRKHTNASGEKYKEVKASYFDYKKKGRDYRIPQVFNWEGKNPMPYFTLNKNYKTKNYITSTNSYSQIKLNIKDWMAFLGFWMAEGYTCRQKKSGHYIVGVCQNHSIKSDKKIEYILNKFPFKWYKTKDGWRINSKILYNYLNQFGKSHDKFIPRKILNYKIEYINIFLKWFVYGDGNINKWGTRKAFTVSKQLASDLQEMFFKTGTRARIVKRKSHSCRDGFIYWIEEKIQGKHLSCSMIKTKKIPYKGKIYCLTINSPHTLFVRRNGKACWSGNSYRYFDSTFLVCLNYMDFYHTNRKELKKLPLIITPNRPFTSDWLDNTLLINKNYSLSGILALDIATKMLGKGDVIFLLGMDGGAINDIKDAQGRKTTHFYQNWIEHRGIGETTYYECAGHNIRNFGRFLDSDCTIYNVSPDSNINCFEKIDYNTFFKKLDNKTYNQDILRREITILKKGSQPI